MSKRVQRPYGPETEAVVFDVGRTIYRGKARQRVAPAYTRQALEGLGLSHRGLDDDQIRAAYRVATQEVRARYATTYFRKGGPGPNREVWLEHNGLVAAALGVSHPEFAVRLERQWGGWAPVLQPQSGARQTLELLRDRGYRLGVFSNTFRDHRVRFRQDGLLGLFEIFLLSFELGVWKPAAEAFTRSAEALGLSPSQVVYVGDKWQVDVVPAMGVGMGAVLLEEPSRWPAEPGEARLIERFESLSELLPERGRGA